MLSIKSATHSNQNAQKMQAFTPFRSRKFSGARAGWVLAAGFAILKILPPRAVCGEAADFLNFFGAVFWDSPKIGATFSQGSTP